MAKAISAAEAEAALVCAAHAAARKYDEKGVWPYSNEARAPWKRREFWEDIARSPRTTSNLYSVLHYDKIHDSMTKATDTERRSLRRAAPRSSCWTRGDVLSAKRCISLATAVGARLFRDATTSETQPSGARAPERSRRLCSRETGDATYREHCALLFEG
jgi:hypothetical protein